MFLQLAPVTPHTALVVFDIAGLQPSNGKRIKHSLTHQGLKQGSGVMGFAPGEAVEKWIIWPGSWAVVVNSFIPPSGCFLMTHPVDRWRIRVFCKPHTFPSEEGKAFESCYPLMVEGSLTWSLTRSVSSQLGYCLSSPTCFSLLGLETRMVGI